MRYVEAANRFDPSAAVACFSRDAVVHDEQQDHVGANAIARWIAQTSRDYRPHVTVIRAQTTGDTVRMGVTVAGDFPGSPVDLDYELRLRDGKIARLNIR